MGWLKDTAGWELWMPQKTACADPFGARWAKASDRPSSSHTQPQKSTQIKCAQHRSCNIQTVNPCEGFSLRTSDYFLYPVGLLTLCVATAFVSFFLRLAAASCCITRSLSVCAFQRDKQTLKMAFFNICCSQISFRSHLHLCCQGGSPPPGGGGITATERTK